MDAAPNFGLSLRWITVTCFEFRFGSLRVVSDPFITDAPGTELDGSAIEACDLITLSHGHWDHIMDLPLLMERFQPRLLCGELSYALGIPLEETRDRVEAAIRRQAPTASDEAAI